jgi:hypothetical protein
MGTSKSLTVNQLKDMFEDFATRHLQLNSFYFGPVDKIGDSEEFVYPMFGAIPGEVIITSNQGTDVQRGAEFRFTILAADLEKRDDSNETEIRSDMVQILSDFIAECDQHEFFYENNLEITGDLTMTPFTERFSDLVTGYALNFNIRAPFKYLYCDAPIAFKSTGVIIGGC